MRRSRLDAAVDPVPEVVEQAAYEDRALLGERRVFWALHGDTQGIGHSLDVLPLHREVEIEVLKARDRGAWEQTEALVERLQHRQPGPLERVIAAERGE